MKHLIEGRVLQHCDITIEVSAEPYFTCPGLHHKDVKWGSCIENNADNDYVCKYYQGIATKVVDPYSKCYEKGYIKCSLKVEIDAKRSSRKVLATKAMAEKCVEAGDMLSAFINR